MSKIQKININEIAKLYGKNNLLIVLDSEYKIICHNAVAKNKIKSWFKKNVEIGRSIYELIYYLNYREYFELLENVAKKKTATCFIYDEEKNTYVNQLYFFDGHLVMVILPKRKVADSKTFFYESIPEILYRVEFTLNGERKVRVLSGSFSKALNVNTNEYFEDILQGKINKYVPEEDIAKILQSAKFLKNKKYIKLVYRFINPKTKKVLWLEEKVVKKYTKNGEVASNIGITRVVTREINYLQKLKENEEKYRLIFENNQSGLFISELETGKIVECNQSFAKILGYNKNELINNFSDKLYFDQNDRKNYIQELLKHRYLNAYKIKLRHKTGRPVWIMENVKIFEDKQSGKLMLQGSAIDITQNIEYEEKLVQKEKEISQWIDSSPFGIVILYRSKILYCNQKFLHITGIKSHKLEYIKFDQFFTKTDYNKIRKLIKNKDFKKPIETQILKKKKKPVDVELMFKEVIHRELPCLMVTINDISMRKELERTRMRTQLAYEINKSLREEINLRKAIEKELIATQKFNARLIESSLDMIIAADTKGRIVEFNPSACKTFGYTYNEILGKNLEILYAGKEELKNVNQSLAKYGFFAGEIVNKKKSGEEFISFLSATQLKDENGKIIGSMGISRDITQEKINQQKLIQSEQTIKAIISGIPDTILNIDKKTFEVKEIFNKNKLGIDDLFKDNITLPAKIHAICNNHLLCNAVLNDYYEGKKSNKILIKKNNKEFYIQYLFSELNEKEILLILSNITNEEKANKEIIKSLHEKEILLKEIHHRVKNNLQVISSILNLQLSYTKNDKLNRIIKESQNRIKSMAFLHEELYRNKDFTKINFNQYIHNLTNHLKHSFNPDDKQIEINIKNQVEKMHIDYAMPCGLIINELVSNSFKYAFENKNKGIINIDIQKKENLIKIAVEDNGIGIPEEKLNNFEENGSLGWQLIKSLCDQLDAQIFLKSDKGFKFVFEFEIPKTHA
jgi:PAS domain S-box-containing protein